jgi:hypothetical protein
MDEGVNPIRDQIISLRGRIERVLAASIPDPIDILDALRLLKELPMTISLLSVTKVGVLIAKLKKEGIIIIVSIITTNVSMYGMDGL